MYVYTYVYLHLSLSLYIYIYIGLQDHKHTPTFVHLLNCRHVAWRGLHTCYNWRCLHVYTIIGHTPALLQDIYIYICIYMYIYICIHLHHFMFVLCIYATYGYIYKKITNIYIRHDTMTNHPKNGSVCGAHMSSQIHGKCLYDVYTYDVYTHPLD